MTTKDQMRSLARSMLKVVAMLAAFEVALLVHHGLERGELLLVDEHAKLARLLEVDHGDEEGGALDAVVALRRHVGERAGQQRAAEAVADDVDLALAGRLGSIASSAARIALEHVVLEALLGELLVRIDPGDHEHRVALLRPPIGRSEFFGRRSRM